MFGYVFQEVLDENDRVKILKPSRFGHDYKVTEEITFNYLKTEEVRERQEAGEILDSRYFPPCISNTGKAPCALGQIADKK